MIKGYYIDSVCDMVNGGDTNSQNEVWREDIAALLPAAYNFVVLGALWDQFAKEGDKDINSSMVVPFVNQVINTTGTVPTFTIPETFVDLPGDRGLRMVTSPENGNFYQKMNDNLYANWNYYKKIMIDQRFYRLVGKVGYLYNKPKMETKLNLYLLVSTDHYTDNDELPVPAGKELIMIQELFKLFSKQQLEGQQDNQLKSDYNK